MSHPLDCILESFSSDIAFQFGDQRVNRRANFMTKKMAQCAEKAIPQVFCNGADLKGAYRFFNNNLVTPEKILQPHKLETVKRCKHQKIVGVIQDSSDLDFDYMECLEGFNSMHINVDKGFRIHPSLAITEKGTPLGVLAASNYTRENENSSKKHRNDLPIEEKESFRWLTGFRVACELAEQIPGVQVISIADREGDIYECLAEAQIVDTKHKADILVRSNHNRTLADTTDETADKLEKKLVRCSVKYEGKVTLNKYKKHERTASIAIRACKILINAPKTSKKKTLPPIEMNAVLVSEIDPPRVPTRSKKSKTADDDVKPLYWLLLTTLPIETLEEIQFIVSMYSKRWCIEIFFKVIKSGCKIDIPHLQTPARIKRFIALAMVVAWKVMLTTYLPREYPDVLCTSVFTEIEWKLAFSRVHTKPTPFPEPPPTLKEMVGYVAMLGGYQKRKDPPGIQTVWRGIMRVIDMVHGHELTQGILSSQ